MENESAETLTKLGTKALEEDREVTTTAVSGDNGYWEAGLKQFEAKQETSVDNIEPSTESRIAVVETEEAREISSGMVEYNVKVTEIGPGYEKIGESNQSLIGADAETMPGSDYVEDAVEGYLNPGATDKVESNSSAGGDLNFLNDSDNSDDEIYVIE